MRGPLAGGKKRSRKAQSLNTGGSNPPSTKKYMTVEQAIAETEAHARGRKVRTILVPMKRSEMVGLDGLAGLADEIHIQHDEKGEWAFCIGFYEKGPTLGDYAIKDSSKM